MGAKAFRSEQAKTCAGGRPESYWETRAPNPYTATFSSTSSFIPSYKEGKEGRSEKEGIAKVERQKLKYREAKLSKQVDEIYC